jgi:hypothetical protein
VISRSIVILLAFGAAALRASQGAWVETIGLVALGTGLLFLRGVKRRPEFRLYAIVCFATTAISVIVSFSRQYL